MILIIAEFRGVYGPFNSSKEGETFLIEKKIIDPMCYGIETIKIKEEDLNKEWIPATEKGVYVKTSEIIAP